ncbi:hypothetical protein HAP47_0016860 [Bradyrhizobium sp. 41S5]|uniref:hypothetical protein n=1 Tax=Bradyrhizobium sp. 41S5 TaxID=1404443 RepID=UPI00156B610B|nr:hypothetical protein [Bradyrhizobium sp. 41S5]UFX48236.1 hypothetical protein HAP47_0016860 [Bradyrhizobium sp. 41S5]
MDYPQRLTEAVVFRSRRDASHHRRHLRNTQDSGDSSKEPCAAGSQAKQDDIRHLSALYETQLVHLPLEASSRQLANQASAGLKRVSDIGDHRALPADIDSRLE